MEETEKLTGELAFVVVHTRLAGLSRETERQLHVLTLRTQLS